MLAIGSVTGILRRTDRGELSVKVTNWQMLTRRCSHCRTSGTGWLM